MSHPEASRVPSTALSHRGCLTSGKCHYPAFELLPEVHCGLLLSEIYVVPSSYMKILACSSLGQGGWLSCRVEVLLCVGAGLLFAALRSMWFAQNSLHYSLYKLAELYSKFITLICLRGQIQSSHTTA